MRFIFFIFSVKNAISHVKTVKGMLSHVHTVSLCGRFNIVSKDCPVQERGRQRSKKNANVNGP